MKQLWTITKCLIGQCLYLASGVISFILVRDNNKVVFGCYKNKFSDNAKYLYLHWHKTQFKRVIWISGDPKVIAKLKQQQMEAYPRWSIQGIWHSLTAKYFCYTSYIGDVNQHLAMGAFKINLWHGSPMKKIEFDIDTGPLTKVYQQIEAGNGVESYLAGQACNVWRKIRYHQEYIKPDLMLSPSPLIDKLFCSAFRLNKETLLRTGFPRTDYYRLYSDMSANHVFDNQGHKHEFHHYDKLVLYAPSWRDYLLDENSQQRSSKLGANPYQAAIDWQAMSNTLVKANSLLLVRFHPNEAHLGESIKDYPNIIDISARDDVYDLLHAINLLITDYSSLFIDILPLNAEIAFFQFDHYQYQRDCRGQYDDYKAINFPIKTLYEQEALLTYIAAPSVSRQAIKNKYQNMSNLFWQLGLPSSFTAISKAISAVENKTSIALKPKNRVDG